MVYLASAEGRTNVSTIIRTRAHRLIIPHLLRPHRPGRPVRDCVALHVSLALSLIGLWYPSRSSLSRAASTSREGGYASSTGSAGVADKSLADIARLCEEGGPEATQLLEQLLALKG